MTKTEKDALLTVRVVGIGVILALIVLVTVADVIDGLFLGDVYHVDITFYGLCTGLIVTFLTGAAIERVAGKRNGGGSDDGGE